MLERSILSGMVGRWACVLIDCDLVYESLHPRKDRGICGYIIDQRLRMRKILVVVVLTHKILDRSVVRIKAPVMF
jgi:hypothetical protein